MQDLLPSVLSLALLMAVVAFLPPLAKRLRVPHNIPLALLGLLLGSLILFWPASGEMSFLNDTISGFRSIRISSDVFLYLFLPILLFAGALDVDVRRLQDDFAPILVLAVVAVLACTFFVGYTLFWLFSLPLMACLLLGAVIAATDPSAVVSIFRDLGAPRRLTLLVEGESLFNDAAAIVLFGFFASVMAGGAMASPLSAVLSGGWAFLGGILFGGGLAFLAIECARFLKTHPVAEITMTLALAYIAFIVSTVYLEASGAVASVTAGLVVAARGRTRLSPESWMRLSNVWEQLSFWAVSLIFVLAAMLIPRIFRGLNWGRRPDAGGCNHRCGREPGDYCLWHASGPGLLRTDKCLQFSS